MTLDKQPWLSSARFDGLWILSPPFLATLGIALLFTIRPELASAEMSPWAWLFLVLAIDVSHVYASVYRTLLNPVLREKFAFPLSILPMLAYLIGFALYKQNPLWFWRALAYLAVFHFVRQPYGLMMLYKRKGPIEPLSWHRLDQIAIYTASLYPIWCWHFDPSRSFAWFIDGDFFAGNSPAMILLGHVFALIVALTYIGKEIVSMRIRGQLNLPKNLVLLGTALSFGMGILYWNSDLAFTATNVIGHGLAYLALVWWSDGKRHFEDHWNARLKPMFPVIFASLLLSLAFFEEGLWDLLLWNEHRIFFEPIKKGIATLGIELSTVQSNEALAYLVPLLALPQATHYLWDGFIWRRQASLSRN